MIQRIQTVWLILAASLIAVLGYNPIARLLTADGRLLTMWFNRISGAQQKISLLAAEIFLYGLMIILLVTILLYRNRQVQLRLCRVASILLIGFTALIAGVLAMYTHKGLIVYFHFSSVIPPVALILVYLAARAIKKDEELVKSADRIR